MKHFRMMMVTLGVAAACDAGSTELETATESGTSSATEPGVTTGADATSDDATNGTGGALPTETEGQGETTVDPGSCPANLSWCGGACIDPATDTAHCGGCDRGCGSEQLCSQSACVDAPADCTAAGAACPTGYFCDLGSQQCQLGCAFDDQCPQPGSCDLSSHLCDCDPGTVSCAGSCVAQSVDACGVDCEPCTDAPAHATPTCRDGSCDFSCDPGFHSCGGECVADDSTAHCGTGCSACPGDPNGTATCDGLACGLSCSTGFYPAEAGCLECPSTAAESEPNDSLAQADTIPGTPGQVFGAQGYGCFIGDVDVWTLTTSATGIFHFVVPNGDGTWQVVVRQGGTVHVSEECSYQQCDGTDVVEVVHGIPLEIQVELISGSAPQDYFVGLSQL